MRDTWQEDDRQQTQAPGDDLSPAARYREREVFVVLEKSSGPDETERSAIRNQIDFVSRRSSLP